MQASKNPRQRFLEITRDNLIARLETLLARLDNPNLTREQLDSVKADVAACQAQLAKLGLMPIPPSAPAEPDAVDPSTDASTDVPKR